MEAKVVLEGENAHHHVGLGVVQNQKHEKVKDLGHAQNSVALHFHGHVVEDLIVVGDHPVFELCFEKNEFVANGDIVKAVDILGDRIVFEGGDLHLQRKVDEQVEFVQIVQVELVENYCLRGHQDDKIFGVREVVVHNVDGFKERCHVLLFEHVLVHLVVNDFYDIDCLVTIFKIRIRIQL